MDPPKARLRWLEIPPSNCTAREETPVSFTLGGLDALLTSLEGKTLNGQWECVLVQAYAANGPVEDAELKTFTMEFRIPPGLISGPQPWVVLERTQFVSSRIRLGGGLEMPETIGSADDMDDVALATVRVESDYQEGLVEESITLQHAFDNVVALLPQNPFIEAGIESSIQVVVDNQTVQFNYQTREGKHAVLRQHR